MKVNDKVIYNSITGSVTAKVVGFKFPTAKRGSQHQFERITLRSTSRSNPYYPAGFEWEVPAGSASIRLQGVWSTTGPPTPCLDPSA